MPSGPVQTQRVRCIFTKLKDNPNVTDKFVDGDVTIVHIGLNWVDGLQDINRNYGHVTDDEFKQFFATARPRA
jgi:hypothetical protein